FAKDGCVYAGPGHGCRPRPVPPVTYTIDPRSCSILSFRTMWPCPLAGMMQVDMSRRTAAFYTIHVEGQLGAALAPEPAGLASSAGPDGTTRLAGYLADQAALLGCLNRLINLGAIVLSVESETGQLTKGKENMLQELTLIQEVEETKIRAQLEKM